MKRILSLCLLLVACGTPQENCISRNTRDLRVVDRLIAETEGNLARGYAIEEITVYHRVRVDCTPGRLPVSGGACWERDSDTIERPKAIDLAAERRTLAGLQAKRAELARNADAVIAQCRAQYPE